VSVHYFADMPPPVDASRPLAGLRVAITREASRARVLEEALRARGADVRLVPLVRTEALAQASLDAALRRAVPFDWVLFTSRTAVRFALEARARLGGTARALDGAAVAAVGPDTAAALRDGGLAPALVPTRHSGDGLLEALTARVTPGARVLHVVAAGAADLLPRGLARLGADVTVVHPYRTVEDETGARTMRSLLAEREVDVAVVTAPSAVRVLARVAGETRARSAVRVASIGATTTRAAREAGLTVVAEAQEATPGSLVGALAEWANERSRS